MKKRPGITNALMKDMRSSCNKIVTERKERMSGKMKITGIAVLTMILLAGTAMAQGPGGWSPQAGGSHGGAHEMGAGSGGSGQQSRFGLENLARFRMMFRHLELTDDQSTQIESIMETAREEAMAIMEDSGRSEDRTHFMDVFTAPTLTVGDLEDTMGRMDEVREAMQDVIFEAMVDIHDVLTTGQLEKLAEMAEEHAGAMGPGAGMNRDSGMGHPMR